ncbi:MAG: cytochrome C [Arcobacter sp.]|jgi:cytochrome c553|uniref:c-type cytochrome n=1 Tax=Arcobacter sp. TaxID=1872629 RepID=UPI00258F964E|nr:c-type cytochrome [Arcobacter sp.]MDD3008951.1 cytochrome C [Arcobacter sp.]MDY3204291.1 cytochrome C [Arcobacter sp.]
MKKIVLTTIIAAATAASLSAASIAACATCHGASFEKAALGKSQIVKGWDAAKIEASLKGYKDGTYGGPMKGVMTGQVKNLTEADIKDISAQIAAIK